MGQCLHTYSESGPYRPSPRPCEHRTVRFFQVTLGPRGHCPLHLKCSSPRQPWGLLPPPHSHLAHVVISPGCPRPACFKYELLLPRTNGSLWFPLLLHFFPLLSPTNEHVVLFLLFSLPASILNESLGSMRSEMFAPFVHCCMLHTRHVGSNQ